ncbi:MAG: Mut7-C RNAse domain-containing protein [Thermoplasmata archaeon]
MEVSPRFLCDHMLGTLARWLRLLGYDTAYPEALHDDELLALGAQERRVLLTRDRELAARSRAQALYVVSDRLDEQIRQVLTEIGPGVADPMSRCSVCNGILQDATRAEARLGVPHGVWQRHERFWRCASCGKYYWRGTHWDQMQPTIDGYVALIEKVRRKTRAA